MSWEGGERELAPTRASPNRRIRRSTASVGTTGNGNAFPQVYDTLGRYIFGGVTVKF